MPTSRKTPADHAIRPIRQAIAAHTSALSESDKLAVARGLRQMAEELEAKARERSANFHNLTRAHLEKLMTCQYFLKQHNYSSQITQADSQMPVLVAGPLKIAYNDETGKFMSEIYGITDAAFSHEALCLAAIERLKGKRNP